MSIDTCFFVLGRFDVRTVLKQEWRIAVLLTVLAASGRKLRPRSIKLENGVPYEPGKLVLDDRKLRELMIRYQAADLSAADELIGSVSGALLHFLAGPKSTRALSDDLLQECWLQIHKSRHSYRPEAPLLPWIYAIAWHVRRNAYRRLCHEQEQNAEHAHRLAGIHYTSMADCDDVLGTLLRRLPDAQRRVIEMLKLDRKSLREVAVATSSTVGAVKQRAHRAYRNLRDLAQTGILD